MPAQGLDASSSAWILELAEEPQVVFNEQADVMNSILPHGDPFDAKTEGPAGVDFRVDSDGFEDIRMHHPAAAKLDPALLVLKPDVAFGGRFGERKEARPEAHLCFGA